jgi:CRP/FNR family transcriptional regulator, cyclic AMP receptor protein
MVATTAGACAALGDCLEGCQSRTHVSISGRWFRAHDEPCAGAPRRKTATAMGKTKDAPAPTPASLVDWTGVPLQRIEYEPEETIFAQGEPATRVMYVDRGAVRLSVVSHAGREAVIALLERGHFFGEGCLAGQPLRMATATAMASSTIISVEKPDMVRELYARPTFADRFLTHMLTRNIRIEEDLIDQLFNSSEKRLARTLLLLARYGEPQASHRTLPKVSQEMLAEMVGTTRSRVNFFMNKFRKLGFIDYNGDLKINNSLLSVVLRD